MDANRRPDRVIDIFMSMDHYERDRAFRHAMADGDRRRARIVAFTPIPSSWPDPHRAIWRARREQLDIEVTTRQPAINAKGHGYMRDGDGDGVACE